MIAYRWCRDDFVRPSDGLCEPRLSPRGADYASLVGLGVTSLSGESVFSLTFLKGKHRA